MLIDILVKATAKLRGYRTKYYVELLTTRMSAARLYTAIERHIDLMWPISRLPHRIPFFGTAPYRLLLVPDYPNLGLDEEQTKAWAYLDAFDLLALQYDQPQTLATARRWFAEADLCHAEVDYGYNGVDTRARRTSKPGEENSD